MSNKHDQHAKDPRLAFVHIPKCGGTTIQAKLIEWVGRDRCLVAGDKRFGAQIETADRLDLWKSALSRVQLVQGHFAWPTLKNICDKTNSARFRPLGVVREPLARAISEFHYICSYPAHPQFPLLTELSIGEFLLNHHRHNIQCQFIAHTDLFFPTLEVVKTDFCGLAPIEDLDVFADRLAHALGRVPGPVKARNVGLTAAENPDVTPATISEFYEKNVADLRLYWWARRNWTTHWKL